ncbi:MAG: hypothetical protein R2706_12800 [Acidimicrobiales bacterium]
MSERHGGPIDVGHPANITVIDPSQRWIVDPSALASNAVNTPYAGRELTGKTKHTIYRGTPTVIEGKVTR